MSKVLYEKRSGIAYITLNRPEVRNAIDRETDDLLYQAWTDFRDDPDLRVAILTGAGDIAFCAGADLSTHIDPWINAGPELGRSVLHRGFAGGITRGLHDINKPIIAALNGWVIGGGIELALACDIRIASANARFGFFHMRRGMHFADGGLVRLIDTCGVGIATELELTAAEIDATRAREIHLVNHVLPPEELMPKAQELAAQILRNPRVAVESAKETIREVIGRPMADKLRLEALYGYATMGDPEIAKRRTEFLERRDEGRSAPTR
jgi:enoyl-CoA hydratase